MLIPSQLTLIKRCQQQGGKSYQLSKITNDSARGREETSWRMSGGVGGNPGTSGNLGPRSRHPAQGVTLCPLYPKCLPCFILAVSTICLSHCSHHARRTLHSLHAHPVQHTYNPQTPVITLCPVPAASTKPAMFTPHTYMHPQLTYHATCPARRAKAATLPVLSAPIVHALWYTCTGNIPAGSADRGHVSARRLNRRD